MPALTEGINNPLKHPTPDTFGWCRESKHTMSTTWNWMLTYNGGGQEGSPGREGLLLSVAKLLAEWCIDPYTQVVWDGIETPITREEVAAAIAAGVGGDVPSDLTPTEGLTRAFHVQRVAWFVIHGWSNPIEVDLGVPVMGFYPTWPILDGNHRFAAAVYRGDEAILARVAGQMSWIETFVVGSKREYEAAL